MISANKPIIFTILVALCLSACIKQEYQPQPLDASVQADIFYHRSLSSDSLREFMSEHGFQTRQWPLQSWDNNALILAALHYHPDLLLARAEYRLSRSREIGAGQRPNPGIGISPEIHSSDSNGESPLTMGLLLDWPLERRAKRQARIDQALSQSEASLSEIRQMAWNIRDRVNRNYIKYVDAAGRMHVLQQREALLAENLKLLHRRVELGESGSFELSTLRLDLHRQQLDILTQEGRKAAALGALADSIGITLAALEGLNISMQGGDLSPADRQLDIVQLQTEALQSRHDILASLQRYAASEAALREKIEQQQPDINLSPAYLFDQGDNVWALGISWLLPLFHSHEGAIAEARAERDLRAAEFIKLQMQVIGQLQNSFIRYQHSLRFWRSAKSLEADLRARLSLIERQFKLGYADRIELNRHRLELYAASLSMHDAKFDALRALADMEQSAQQSLRSRVSLWNPERLSGEQP